MGVSQRRAVARADVIAFLVAGLVSLPLLGLIRE
jgi:hypothetical protein